MALRILFIDPDQMCPADLRQLPVPGGAQVLLPSDLPVARRGDGSLVDLAVVVVTESTSLDDGQLFLTARAVQAPLLAIGPDDLKLQLAALGNGADGFACWSGGIDLIALHARCLVRRPERSQPNLLIHGDLLLDLNSHEVMAGQRHLDLSALEFAILSRLAARGGCLCSRAELTSQLHPRRSLSDRAIENHICRLRAKLRQAGVASEIRTLAGVGYRLVEKAAKNS